MYFYHKTTSDNADLIISEQKINPSFFDIRLYFAYLINNASFTPNKSGETLPEHYYTPDEKEHYAYWLGGGVYAFNEANLQEAREYNKQNPAIIKIGIDPDALIYNMSSKAHINELRNFLKVGFRQLRDIQKDDGSRQRVSNLQDILIACLKNNFYEMPYAAGILLELYFMLTDRDIPVVSNIFILGKKNKWFTTYYSIRDTGVINTLSRLD